MRRLNQASRQRFGRAVFRRFVSVLVLATVMSAALAGCGIGKSLGASSSCSDFMKASPQEQDQAISKLAVDLHAPNSVTPLGRPNIDYLCVQQPNWTLGDAVRHTG